MVVGSVSCDLVLGVDFLAEVLLQTGVEKVQVLHFVSEVSHVQFEVEPITAPNLELAPDLGILLLPELVHLLLHFGNARPIRARDGPGVLQVVFVC